MKRFVYWLRRLFVHLCPRVMTSDNGERSRNPSSVPQGSAREPAEIAQRGPNLDGTYNSTVQRESDMMDGLGESGFPTVAHNAADANSSTESSDSLSDKTISSRFDNKDDRKNHGDVDGQDNSLPSLMIDPSSLMSNDIVLAEGNADYWFDQVHIESDATSSETSETILIAPPKEEAWSAELSGGYSGKLDSSPYEYKSTSDTFYATGNQGKLPETPVDKPGSSEEIIESLDYKGGGGSLEDSKPVKSITSNNNKSDSSPFNSTEGKAQDSDRLDIQPVEDHESTHSSSASDSADSGEDSTANGVVSKDAHSKTPRRHGGMRGRQSQPSSLSGDSGNKGSFIPRPELVCKKPTGSCQWEVVLVANDECRIREVRHNGKSLEIVNGESRLASFAGSLSMVFEENEPYELSLFDDQPLIFKLRNNWTGDGRRISGITKGYFIVIAPQEWTRKGNAPIEPEGCTDTDFMVHYFFRDGTESAETIGDFEKCPAALTQSGFELKGKRVFDESEDGDLFVGDVPKLKVPKNIIWVRVGEEKQNGWKGENFKLAERTLTEVLNGRQGRFFIRVYGGEVKLLDSDEFRYFADLREIRVNNEPYSLDTLLIPSPTGHPPTEVRFVGADSALIRPILTADGTHATVRPEGTVIVAPHPDEHAVSCALESATGRVEIVLNLPRAWWRMERDASEFREWCDTPIVMTRQEFREQAYADGALQLRTPPRISSVKVGFDNELDRTYSPQNKGDDTNIPLTHFVDYTQVDQRLNEDALLSVECGGATMTLIRVSADPAPTIVSFTNEPTAVTAGEQATLRWETRNAETDGMVIDPDIGKVETSGSRMVAPLETTTYTLRLKASGLDDMTQAVTVIVFPSLPPRGKASARVKRAGGGWRPGKGFSRGEIHAAGLTNADAARRAIPIDKRRRSTHKVDIDMLRRLSDA